MPRRRGISTVLGALLFTVIAVLFIALALRTFTESVSTLTEVASVTAQNAVEERLRITASYTRIASYTASQAGAIVTPLWGSKEGNEALLDQLDGKSLNLTSAATQVGQQQPQSFELVRNGDFSGGSAYWTLEEPWVVDPQQYARVRVSTNRDFTASISQDLGIPLGTVNLTLSFRYYLAASPPGQVNRLELKAYLLSGSNVVWESETIQWDGSQQPVWKQFAQTFPFNLAGPATLKITLFADVKEVGAASSIDAGIDDVSLVAESMGAPPSPVSAAHLVAARIDLARASASANCTLRAAMNTTGFVEVYTPAADGVWVMASKHYVGGGNKWFDVKFTGNASVVYAYSAAPFKLMLDYLQVEELEASPTVDVFVANGGTQPVAVYAVWLNETRKNVEQVLLPGMLMKVSFDVSQLGNLASFEVRVVTATRTHTARFAVGSAEP